MRTALFLLSAFVVGSGVPSAASERVPAALKRSTAFPKHASTTRSSDARDRAAARIRAKAREAITVEASAESAGSAEPAPALDVQTITTRTYTELVRQLIEQADSFDLVNSQNMEARVDWSALELRVPPFWSGSLGSIGAQRLSRALLLGISRFIGENPEALPRIRVEASNDPAFARVFERELAAGTFLKAADLGSFARMKSRNRSLERRTQLKVLEEQTRAVNEAELGVKVASHSRSVSPGKASGDFVHMEVVDGLVHILMADVAGKGKVEPVATEAVWFGGELRKSQDFRIAMQRAGTDPTIPLRFIEDMVRRYQSENRDSEARQEVAATYVIYDPRTRVVKAAYGGGTSPLGIFKADGRATYLMPPRGVRGSNSALGILDRATVDADYAGFRPTIETRLEEGDLLLVTTDGYHDGLNNTALRIGDRLARLLKVPVTRDLANPTYATYPVRETLPDAEALVRLVREEGNIGSRAFVETGDDTTIIALK